MDQGRKLHSQDTSRYIVPRIVGEQVLFLHPFQLRPGLSPAWDVEIWAKKKTLELWSEQSKTSKGSVQDWMFDDFCTGPPLQWGCCRFIVFCLHQSSAYIYCACIYIYIIIYIYICTCFCFNFFCYKHTNYVCIIHIYLHNPVDHERTPLQEWPMASIRLPQQIKAAWYVGRPREENSGYKSMKQAYINISTAYIAL